MQEHMWVIKTPGGVIQRTCRLLLGFFACLKVFGPRSPNHPLFDTGVACAMTFCTLGAGYGMGKSAMGVIHLATLAPSAMLRGLIPVVMSGTCTAFQPTPHICVL